jgi:SAM-dependent methyltransferase
VKATFEQRHFHAGLEGSTITMLTFIDNRPVTPSSTTWEDAYRRFETPDEEIAKFIKRLRELGADAWPRSARIGELFCGRGNGLHALAKLCFTHVEGIDLSPTLAALYTGPGTVTVGDCRSLPWADASKDILIVQGGLHHLPNLEQDLPQVLSEVCRVLVDGGRFVAIEPWLTPFLQFAHAASFSPLRKVMARVDAFATMVEHERETYERWLRLPGLIRSMLEERFRVEHLSFTRGKLRFVGVFEQA